jgi:hypothetical protein
MSTGLYWTISMITDLIMTGDSVLGSIFDAFNPVDLSNRDFLNKKLTELVNKMNKAGINYEQYVQGNANVRNEVSAIVARMAPVGSAYSTLKEKEKELKQEADTKTKEYADYSKSLLDQQAEVEKKLTTEQTKVEQQAQKQGRGGIYNVTQWLQNLLGGKK